MACLVPAWHTPARAAPPVTPIPAPDYSFDKYSPSSTVSAADVLNVQYPHPFAVLSGAALGLFSPFDDLDALCGGNAGLAPGDRFMLLFSISRSSTGAAAPAPELVALGIPYNPADQVLRGHAAGDEYCSTEVYTESGDTGEPDGGVSWNSFLTRNNFDEGGTSHAAFPETSAETMLPGPVEQDNVDALSRLPRLPDGTIATVYFSLSADSPSLPMLAYPGPASGADVFFAVSPLVPPLDGACCLPGGTCEVMSGMVCTAAGGHFLGMGSTCDQCSGTPPPPGEHQGACCFPNGTCQILLCRDCMMAGGLFLGADTMCDMCAEPPPPPEEHQGACCYMDGTCEILTGHECMMSFGRFLGPGTTCDMCETPPEEHQGACCYLNRPCDILNERDCMMSGGFFIGPDTTCDMCPEPPPGYGYMIWPYALHDELGLRLDDDLDALVVIDVDGNGRFDGTDFVLFSLAPGSPSLLTLGGAADIFKVTPGSPPGSSPVVTLFATAADLGLAASDDVDALDLLVIGPSRETQAAEHGIRRLLGDLNCDGQVNVFDIDPFVQAMSSPRAYFENHRDCDAGMADLDGDGAITAFDIDAFVAALTGRPVGD